MSNNSINLNGLPEINNRGASGPAAQQRSQQRQQQPTGQARGATQSQQRASAQAQVQSQQRAAAQAQAQSQAQQRASAQAQARSQAQPRAAAQAQAQSQAQAQAQAQQRAATQTQAQAHTPAQTQASLQQHPAAVSQPIPLQTQPVIGHASISQPLPIASQAVALDPSNSGVVLTQGVPVASQPILILPVNTVQPAYNQSSPYGSQPHYEPPYDPIYDQPPFDPHYAQPGYEPPYNSASYSSRPPYGQGPGPYGHAPFGPGAYPLSPYEEEKRRRRKGCIIWFFALLLLAAGIALGAWYYFNEYLPAQEGAKTQQEEEPTGDTVSKINDKDAQAYVNEQVAESEININYSPTCTIGAGGKKSTSFMVRNIEANHGAIKFKIFDSTGKVIYESPEIDRGYEMTGITLSDALAPGTHNCRISIGYVDAGNVSSTFPLEVIVS